MRPKRTRLPPTPSLVLDEKLVNLIRFYKFLEEELKKPQKRAIYVSSMLGEQDDFGRMVLERLLWLLNEQYPDSKFIWGRVKRQKKLPDRMPKSLQREVKRYAEKNGLPFP